ncbi:hypothetical protein GW17_00053853 [Ensete ventricosum]|nr:hypothetical protein GW17_00053853 [Ensete ventricosum]
MSYRVFGVLRQSVDQGLDPVDLRFSFFLRALYPKEPSLALVEFLQARFKNIEAGFHRSKPLFVAPFSSWRTRLCILCSRRVPNFTLVMFTVALLMSSSSSLRAIIASITAYATLPASTAAILHCHLPPLFPTLFPPLSSHAFDRRRHQQQSPQPQHQPPATPIISVLLLLSHTIIATPSCVIASASQPQPSAFRYNNHAFTAALYPRVLHTTTVTLLALNNS